VMLGCKLSFVESVKVLQSHSCNTHAAMDNSARRNSRLNIS
jgi:hypothetical protein